MVPPLRPAPCSKYAYIVIAMRGKTFCTAAMQATMIIIANAKQVRLVVVHAHVLVGLRTRLRLCLVDLLHSQSRAVPRWC